MRRFVVAVSLSHLFFLGSYVKLGAIRPWQAVGSVFGGSSLWVALMLSAACAPLVLGAAVWMIDSVWQRRLIRLLPYIVLCKMPART